MAAPNPKHAVDLSPRADPPRREQRLAPERYTSHAFMEQEWTHLFSRVWQIGCLESELSAPGDFVTADFGRESLLFTRDREGSVRGYYNVCQHRGNRLVGDERGHGGAFVCPYHGWVWGTDGSLQRVQDPEDFPHGDPCEALRLAEVRVETWGGFVWFHLGEDTESLADFLAPVAREVDSYRLPEMVRTHHITLEADCNWKVVLDNFHESYHIPTVHPALKFFLNDTYQTTQFHLYPRGHTRMWMRGGGPSPRAGDREDRILAVMKSELEAWDLDPESFRGRVDAMRGALQENKRALGAERGFDFSRYLDAQLTDHFHYTVFPNVALSMKPDGCIFLRALPHARDPERCFFDVWYFTLFPEGEDEYYAMSMSDPVRRNDEVPHQRGRLGEIHLGGGIDEDASVFISQQQGLRSRGYKGAHLASQERRVAWYHQVIDDHLARPRD